MKTCYKWVILQVFFILMCSSIVYGRNISPIDYGILKTQDGKERYEILLKVHTIASNKNQGVTYAGISKLDLIIPENPQTIPLSRYTDFAGVQISVLNQSKSFHLFTLQGERKTITIDKASLEKQYFGNYPELKKGRKVLVIEDQEPWVKNRRGYNDGASRADILYLRNGKANNSPVQAYSTIESRPIFSYFEASKKKKVIKNLVFIRLPESTALTYLLRLDGQDNVEIENIRTETPLSEKFADQIFTFTRSTNVKCKNITINGTYSQTDKYGYGISMNNVWNIRFNQLKAVGNWGVFGNYNVNKVQLDDCDFNRFDIHCYGKDVFFYNCTFRKLYNQYASFYGELYYENCTFLSSIPLLIEDSYSAYTPFNVTLKDCEIQANEKNNFLVAAGNLHPDIKANRAELRVVCLPDVTMKNVTVHLSNGATSWHIFDVGGKNTLPIEEENKVFLDNVSIVNTEGMIVPVEYSNKRLDHQKRPLVSTKNSIFKIFDF